MFLLLINECFFSSKKTDNVTDSAYGNAVAQLTLLAAYTLAPAAGAIANETFKNIADNLVIPYDTLGDYHPEYVGWNSSVVIKQVSASNQFEKCVYLGVLDTCTALVGSSA